NFSVRKAISSITETDTLRVRVSKLSNPILAHSLVNCLLEIGPCSPPLRNDPETIRETFQAVSRNAETLALQMNHLRELDLETIKKNPRNDSASYLRTPSWFLQNWAQEFSIAPWIHPPRRDD